MREVIWRRCQEVKSDKLIQIDSYDRSDLNTGVSIYVDPFTPAILYRVWESYEEYPATWEVGNVHDHKEI